MTSIFNADLKPKVLLVSTEVMHYRVPVYNYFHAHFCEIGYDFLVITNHLQAENCRPLDFTLIEEPFNFPNCRTTLSRLSPACVILFLQLKSPTTWLLMLWLKARRIPFALWTKGRNLDAKESWLRARLFDLSHALCDALVVYSNGCVRYTSPRFRKKIFVANNTLNFEAFARIDETKSEIKKAFQIPFKKVVLFVGRMAEGNGRKRVSTLIDIFASTQRRDVGLVLVGSGFSEDLRTRMNSDNTMYLGEVHDAQDRAISQLFSIADVYAVPGHVGLGLNQAFFWKVPVVTEDCNQPPEIEYLKPGWNGIIVPNNDRESFTNALFSLLDDDQLRAEYGAQARDTILREASIENMFAGFRDCVEYLVRRRKD